MPRNQSPSSKLNLLRTLSRVIPSSQVTPICVRRKNFGTFIVLWFIVYSLLVRSLAHNSFAVLKSFYYVCCYLMTTDVAHASGDPSAGEYNWWPRLTVERGNFGRWGNFEQLMKKHLTLSYSFDFFTVVRTSRAETTTKKSKLLLKVKCPSSGPVQSYPIFQSYPVLRY